MGIWVFFFVKETKGRSLEDMDILFGTVNAEQRAEDVERVLHDKVVHEEVENAAGAENTGTSVGLEDRNPAAVK